MRVLIVGRPTGWTVKKVTKDGKKRGVHVEACRTHSLVSVHNGKELSITVDGKSIFDYDLIHLFTVQENRMRWYAAAAEAAKRGVKIVDEDCLTLLVHEQSLLSRLTKQAELSIPFPPTTIIGSFVEAMKFLRSSPRPVVVKTLNSRQGRGVALIRNRFDLLRFYLRQRGNTSFAFRQFIEGEGDYRVTVIDGVARAIVHRKGRKGEWRNNLSLGGAATHVSMADAPLLVEAAEKAARAARLDIAGVDLLVGKDGVPYLLEVNRSPDLSPDLDELGRMPEINLEDHLLDLYVNRINRK